MLVKETISFERYRDPKDSLFGPARKISMFIQKLKEDPRVISVDLSYIFFNKRALRIDFDESYGIKSLSQIISRSGGSIFFGKIRFRTHDGNYVYEIKKEYIDDFEIILL